MPHSAPPSARYPGSAPVLVRKTATSPAQHRKRMRRLQHKFAKTIKEQRRIAKIHGLYAVALTLTYRPTQMPKGKDISSFLDKLRAKLKRGGKPLLYTWVLECKHAYHYHLMVWLPRGIRLERTLLERWWPHGYFEAEACRSPHRWGKYMAKSETKESLPAGQRLFGYGGLDQAGEDAVRRACLPRWLQQVLPVFSRPQRCRGGGWVDVLTGEVFISPYVWTPRGIKLRAGASVRMKLGCRATGEMTLSPKTVSLAE